MNQDQTFSSNLQNQSYGPSTNLTDTDNKTSNQTSNPSLSPPDPSFRAPPSSTNPPESRPQPTNPGMMNDEELYQYLYNPNRSVHLNTLTDFLKKSIPELQSSDLLSNPSQGKYYQAWLQARSTTHSSQSLNPNSIGSSDLSYMEIDEKSTSEDVGQCTLAKMMNGMSDGESVGINDLNQVEVDVEMLER